MVQVIARSIPAFRMAAQQERRSPQVAQQLFQHLGAAARAASPATPKQLPLPGDPHLLPLLLRVGDALHSRVGNTAGDSALQRFQDSLLWTPEVRYGSCMSRFACVACWNRVDHDIHTTTELAHK
jgi:hypothetical protein